MQKINVLLHTPLPVFRAALAKQESTELKKKQKTNP